MLRLIKLFIWIAIFSALALYINYKDFTTTSLSENKTILVQPWDHLQKVLQRDFGYNELFVKIYLNLNPEKKISIQAGEYRLLVGENIASIINTLSYGAMTIDTKLTFLEGWNIFDIDEYLSAKELIESGVFMSEAEDIEKYRSLYPFLSNALTLEWYLYPDTYFVNPNNISAESITKMMLDNFRQKIYTPLLSPLTETQRQELIIIASIVEKEERNIAEKSTVAGILIKRYKERWMIWADITVCYPYRLTSKACTPSFIASKVNIDKNEYNTRTMVWLPKTPINNPGIESIKATLNPKTTPYYYYLHDNNGKVYYAITNEEHNRNKRLYLR